MDKIIIPSNVDHLDWSNDAQVSSTLGKVLFSSNREAEAAGEVDYVFDALGIAPGHSILDIGCGIGRHSVRFAQRGAAVTGVDSNQVFITEANRRVANEAMNIRFCQADARELPFAGVFDFAVSLHMSMGYHLSPSEDLRILKSAYKSLRAGGKLLIEILGKEAVMRNFRPRDWRCEDGVYVLETRQLANDSSYVSNVWHMIENGSVSTIAMSLWLYSQVEIGTLLHNAGFADVKIYGGLDLKPYIQSTHLLVAVAKKLGM